MRFELLIHQLKSKGLRVNGVAVHANTVMSAVTALLIDSGKHVLLITKKFQPKESWAYKWLK